MGYVYQKLKNNNNKKIPIKPINNGYDILLIINRFQPICKKRQKQPLLDIIVTFFNTSSYQFCDMKSF